MSNRGSYTNLPQQSYQTQNQSHSQNIHQQFDQHQQSQQQQSQLHQISQNPQQQSQNIDLEGYSTVIVEDLLLGTQEWQNVPEIVRLTIKALTDVVKNQSESLKEIEKILPTRASKNELSTGLQLKANISDVSRTIAEISTHLDQKMSFEDSQLMLKDYTLKSDLQYMLSNKVTLDEVKQLMENNVQINEVQQEFDQVNGKLQELYEEFQQIKINEIGLKDIEKLQSQIEKKADIEEITEALEQKVNKSVVQNALQRKVNRNDLENLLAGKADINDVQNLLKNVESKNELAVVDRISNMVEHKAERSDFTLLIENLNQKAEKHEIDKLLIEIEQLKREFEKQSIQTLRFQEQKQQQIRQNQDNTEIDSQYFQQELLQFKNEIFEDLNRLRDDLQYQNKLQEQNLNQKQEKNDIILVKLGDQINNLNDIINQIQGDISNNQIENQKQKSRRSIEFDTQFKQEIYRVQEDLQNLKISIEDQIQRKVDKKEFIDMKAKIVNSLEQKVELQEVQSALNGCQQDISQRIMQLQQQINKDVKIVENGIKEFTILNLENKLDIEQFEQIIKDKISNKEFKKLCKTIENIAEQQVQYLHTDQFKQHISNTKKTIDLIQKDVLLKANIKDVCTLLDTKCKIDDVNKALTEIHKELDQKPNFDDLNTVAKEQTIINESLCTENIVGRWTWKSGELRPGNLIPWENQIANTLPENFLYEKGKSSILIVAPGLYQINSAFFASKEATASILLNGEPLNIHFNRSNISTTKQSIQQNKKTLPKSSKNLNTHPSGNITGISLQDFIVLPARSKLSITFEGDIGVEGFLGLKRL